MDTEDTTLTLDELSEEVGRLIDRYKLVGAQQDNRVSQVPDARTIRYYSSIGLVDRPKIQGRQAIYRRRHVLQILAIKSLQSINLPLSEIQIRLYGRSDTEIEKLLAGMADFWKREVKVQSGAEPVQSTTWHEIIIEPGIKVLVQEGWHPQNDIKTTINKISNSLEAFWLRGNRGHGGNPNAQP